MFAATGSTTMAATCPLFSSMSLRTDSVSLYTAVNVQAA